MDRKQIIPALLASSAGAIFISFLAILSGYQLFNSDLSIIDFWHFRLLLIGFFLSILLLLGIMAGWVIFFIRYKNKT
ncbi:MAG: hypothetical protein LBI15_10700 [Dysgonamonadaceae bacterium]|jgi:hypothetical protein|nr:hypothetical protein [Dysgonamonadaceae bacterium]